MDNWQVVKATPSHADFIAEHMRHSDVKEIFYQALSDPYTAMQRCLKTDVCLTCLVDGEPAFMFGVHHQGLLSDNGTVWMLGTDNIDKITFGKKELLLMREYVQAMTEGYELIENYVHDENELSKKWLRFLGFTMESPVPFGAFKKPFRHFYMRAE